MNHFLVFLIIFTFTLVKSQDESNKKVWTGKWFPNKPGEAGDLEMTNNEIAQGDHLNLDEHGRIQMGVENKQCDDAKSSLATDFDPNNITHSTAYMCLDNRSEYHDYESEPILTEYVIPTAYTAMHKCMNTSIKYKERIPTFGTHRPLWPKYGEYEYVPVQRWLHSLEHGAIVFLHHPCANSRQTTLIKESVKACLYRHVITPSGRTTKQRPYALVSWGHLLEFSIYDKKLIQEFIQKYALHGPEQTARNGQYEHLLIDPAKTVSTINDDKLCPSKAYQ